MGPQRKVLSAALQWKTRLIAKSLYFLHLYLSVRLLEPWIPQISDHKDAI